MFNTWYELLKSDLTGDRESFEEELNVLRNELLKKHPSLTDLNKYIINLLDNNFFKESMKECYKNYQQKLEEIKKNLGYLVKSKNKFKKVLRDVCHKIDSVSSSDSGNISVNSENTSSGINLDDFIGCYSNEAFLNYFNVALKYIENSPKTLEYAPEVYKGGKDTSRKSISFLLKEISDEIYDEVTSKSFLGEYLEKLHKNLSAEVKSEKYSVGAIESLLKEILAGLLEKGFVKKDLSLNSTPQSQIPSLDSQLQKLDDMIHISTSEWAVIVSIKGIEFKDGGEYKIGKVKFYDKNTYDYSKLIGAISVSSCKTEEGKRKVHSYYKGLIINFFKDKIIAEAEVDAYGKNGAKEKGFLEISRVIDGLSLWKSNVMIQEPKFEKIYEFIVLNQETEKLFPPWTVRDPRYIRKVKLDETIKDFLEDFDPIFNKPYNTFTELEQNVANALHWYRKGNMSVDPFDKFLDHVIALESLLTTEEDERRGKEKIVSDRTVDVIWILAEYRKTFESRIRKMYDHRSEIVHEASVYIPDLENEAEELGDVTRRVICNVASKLSECDTLKRFLELNEEEINNKRDHELENARQSGLDIDKKIKGEGRLKKKSGEDAGEIDFEFWIKDDGKFVVTEGNIYGFKRSGGEPLSFSPSDDFIIEGKLENIEGKLVINEIEPLDIFFGLLHIPNKKEMRFRVYSFDITKPTKVTSRTR